MKREGREKDASLRNFGCRILWEWEGHQEKERLHGDGEGIVGCFELCEKGV